MIRVMLPTVLRAHSDGLAVIEVKGEDVGEALTELTDRFPELRAHLLDDDGQLNHYVNVFVNDENIRDCDHQRTRLAEGDEIVIVPALAGG